MSCRTEGNITWLYTTFDGLLTSVSEQELKDMFTQLGNVVKANGRWKTK